MRGLSAPDVLDLWERAAASGEVERGLVMLSFCEPERSWADLAAVSVGQRDAALLRLRAATLGPSLGVYAVCPGCANELEFEVDSTNMCDAAAPGEHRVQVGKFVAACRLPDSTDLAALRGCTDVAAGRRLIFVRCIRTLEEDGRTVPADSAPDAVVDGFAAWLGEHDPAGEIVLMAQCPACGLAWELCLDIVSFFWRELQAAARRIVLEVDALARGYGWREADILAMSPARRQLYLEMLG